MRENELILNENDAKDEKLRVSINRNIRRLMIEKEVTQRQLSQHIGVSTTKVCRALSLNEDEKSFRGRKVKFNIYELHKISEYFGVTFEQLLTGTTYESKIEHIRTGLDENSIRWLKYIESEKEYLLEIVNLILGNKEIAESMFEAVYLYAVSEIARTYLQKEGTVNERQARFIADDELLLRYAIVGSFEEILKLIKKEYGRYPDNYFQRINEEKINEMCKSLGNNLRIIKNKSSEIDAEYGEDISEFDKEANEYNKIKNSH